MAVTFAHPILHVMNAQDHFGWILRQLHAWIAVLYMIIAPSARQMNALSALELTSLILKLNVTHARKDSTRNVQLALNRTARHVPVPML